MPQLSSRVLGLRYRKGSVRPLAPGEISCVLRNITSILLIKDQQGVSARCCVNRRHREMAPSQRLLWNFEGIVVENYSVFCVKADVVSSDAAVVQLRVEVVGISQSGVGHDVRNNDRSVHPGVDWMGGCCHDR